MTSPSTGRSNEQWLEALRADGPEQEQALADLRAILRTGLRYSLDRWLQPDDPQFEAFAEEVVQETLMRILDRLDTFAGRSRFTTWAHKIAVRVALTDLRRKRWQDVSLESLLDSEAGPVTPAFMADPAAGPEVTAEQRDMLQLLQRLIQEELTEKQRRALVATQVHGMPMEEVARRMGMNRNALYKLLHDARLRLKRALAAQGLDPEDVLASFEGS
jgi:RNA polymerase sigma-70 factor (ECF subfamily)